MPPLPPGPVTLSQVAREAGVSLATASRAINGSATRTVSPELRERVLTAAARLRYSPDANAQAMARGRTTSVGLIVHDISDPYFSSIAAGVTGAAEQADLVVTLASTQHRADRELAFVELMHRQRARAIIVAGGRLDGGASDDALVAALEEYHRHGGGVALVGQPLAALPTVVVANRSGAGDLAGALHALGYRSVGVLAGPAGHRTAADRSAGFAQALQERGTAVGPVVHSAFTRDGGYAGMAELLARPDRPRLVLAVNDVMAVGAMAAARDAGLHVPDDVAVAGFDDIVTLRDVTPALTTVRIPLTSIGEIATRLALGADAGSVEVTGTVVVRDSTPDLRPTAPTTCP
ncbi:LacI family DNA-binding transcriptional regulator [Oerskovia flava]|uniref:LacI family DNA-binding transcriptional regulator n=1 Tax=Oerskovia flava TaxID=2986422 RepID=UPI00224016CA|nr:LacI family DNA-binding transcriptional regulator [Oerskovia sp. JB1-3-2]